MRALSSALNTALVQPVIRVMYLTRIDLDSTVIAFNSAFADVDYGGATYIGSGTLGSISPVQESPGAKVTAVNISLSGIKTEMVSLALSQPLLNRKVRIYGALTDDGFALDSDRVVLLFYGFIDDVQGTMGKTASFSLSVKSRLADWERPRKLRYSDADQQKLYPGDKGMEYIPQLSQRKLVWPKAAFLPDPRDK